MELELTPLSDEPVIIKDASGGRWEASVDLTTSEAMLYRRMTDMTEEAVLHRLSTLVSRSLIARHPDMTPEKVEDTFSPIHLAQIYSAFLAQVGQAPSSSPKSTTPKRKTGARRA